MTDPTARARQERYRAANKRKGLVRVEVSIPEERRAELQVLAAAWRLEHYEQQKGD